MEHFYTDEKNVQVLIGLMKAHGLRKIVISPGTTNIAFVASVQQDSYFELYSSVDERSAAYIACGLAAESGEAVALSCTGATASRNYMSGLTEAFYRKLPILAITSALHQGRIGQHIPQIIDRSQLPNDIAKMSVHIPSIHSSEDKWECEWKINAALLELVRNGGGPVHINLEVQGNSAYSTRELPQVRVMQRFGYNDIFPELSSKNIGIFVGAHKKWDEELIQIVDAFCEKYNGVVFCDHTSNYHGKYGVLTSLITMQEGHRAKCRNVELMIHIGDVSGAYSTIYPEEVWRVDEDGEIRDTFRKLKNVFQMKELDFFKYYLRQKTSLDDMSYWREWKKEYDKLYSMISELPFSNPWIAKNTIGRLPENSILYLGILNSLRSWNFFECKDSVTSYANTGGFGIDGGVSSLLGVSLVNKDKLCYGIMGDLSVFYDMNVLGNRHIPNNLRLMVINNGKGTEFRNYFHVGNQFGNNADDYIAAAGHFGNKSSLLLQHYATDLGFKYLCASNKEQYLEKVEAFITSEKENAPILFEIFTNSEEESEALREIRTLYLSKYTKSYVLELLGQKKKIGIYAATDIAKKILEVIEKEVESNYFEIMVYDKDSKKWGNYISEYEIKSPQSILFDQIERVIIASDFYYNEIYKELEYLKDYGVDIVGLKDA